jgi:hypothetical protein
VSQQGVGAFFAKGAAAAREGGANGFEYDGFVHC